jgi:pimeloyl-ACP methyl ester carboxylesterase
MSSAKRFILVHGAMHGAWCWQKVIPYLEGLDHSVLAVDLPGRQGKGKPGWGLSLQDYIADLTSTVDREQGKVVLVGHSLAGMSIAAVAEKMPHKVERLIFLTAWVSMNGSNMVQLGRENTGSDLHRATGASLLHGLITPKLEAFQEVFCADCSAEDLAWAQSQLVPESIRTAFGRVPLSSERFGSVPTSYVRCANDRALTLAQQQRMLESIGCRRVITLQSSHSPFLSMPQQLAQALHDSAQDESAIAATA